MLLGLLGRHCTCAWYRRAVESDNGLLDALWGSVARALSHVASTRRRLQRGAPAPHPSPGGGGLGEVEGSAPGGEASVSLDQRLQSGRSSAGSVESHPNPNPDPNTQPHPNPNSNPNQVCGVATGACAHAQPPRPAPRPGRRGHGVCRGGAAPRLAGRASLVGRRPRPAVDHAGAS
eukprot:scaffold84017_cov36-Phaeocystis_antarctica.AAC.1